jgi:superfamily I DNA/RNA helicase
MLILAPHRMEPQAAGHGSPIGPWQINPAPAWWESGSADQVRLGTVQAFQGLEADIVVYLAPAYPHKEAARLRYCAMSRARQRVFVLDQALEEPLRRHEDGPQQVGRPFPKELTPANQAALLRSLRP